MNLLDKFDGLLAQKAQLKFDEVDPFKVVIDRVISETEAVIGGHETILAGTNNYMGMTFNQEALAAAHDAIDQFGTGTTGSRVLNGTYNGHKELEAELARFFDRKHCIVFSTGYQALLGTIATIAGKDDYLLLDGDSHASIYDGAAMGNATVVRFKHNDAESLEKRLKRLPADAGKLVVVEGIYSMLGDAAPLKELLTVAKKYGAETLIDEAHSMGPCGAKGRGLAEQLGVEHLADYIAGTFSKSVGTVGGYCVSNNPKFDVLRFTCRPYVFTASPPPSVVASAIKNIQAIEHAGNRRAHLWENANRLHSRLKEAGFQMTTQTAESPIIAVALPDPMIATRFWEALLGEGVYVNMALAFATPGGLNLMRASLSVSHTSEQVDKIIEAYLRTAEKVGLELESAA